MLLSRNEIVRFKRFVEQSNGVIDQDEYDAVDLSATSGKITFILANEELTEGDIPTPDADWSTITVFAQTFNGYPYGDSSARERYDAMLHDWRAVYEQYESVPALLTHLRACLFHEQRSWRHTDVGVPIGSDGMAYTNALLRATRERVRTGQVW